jgi:LacI family transcriptional regulator
VKQTVKELVESSVQMLMKQINGSRERKHLIYDAELLERDSVKFISNS